MKLIIRGIVFTNVQRQRPKAKAGTKGSVPTINTAPISKPISNINTNAVSAITIINRIKMLDDRALDKISFEKLDFSI